MKSNLAILFILIIFSGCASVQFYEGAANKHLEDYRHSDAIDFETEKQPDIKTSSIRYYKKVRLNERFGGEVDIVFQDKLWLGFYAQKTYYEPPVESAFNTICDIRLTDDNILYYVECDTLLWNNYKIIHAYDLEKGYIGKIKVDMKRVSSDFFGG